jgi:NADPH-dependent 7-cyano-7-deazaguanine reductase QueF
MKPLSRSPSPDLTITLRGGLTCTCPFNGRTDSATVVVTYQPALTFIELEAFAAYLAEFATQTISHEDATREILARLNEETEPASLTVTTTWAPVEGIDCIVTATR